jgi:hypothetical protein
LTIAAQKVLVEKTRCKFRLYAPPFEEVVRSVANEKHEWNVQVAGVPELSFFLNPEKAEGVVWTKTWEESKNTPCLVVHTAGTTGMPKPVVYTHQALVHVDAAVLMPEYGPEEDCTENHIAGRLWYSPIPMLHVSKAVQETRPQLTHVDWWRDIYAHLPGMLEKCNGLWSVSRCYTGERSVESGHYTRRKLRCSCVRPSVP